LRRRLPWILGGTVVGLFLTVALLALARQQGASPSGSLPPVLTVIPLPTASPPLILTSTPTPLPTQTPTRPPDAPKQFVAGDLVEVFGTEGEGLRMRESPSLAAEVLLLGLESEVFEVLEGPMEVDGYAWWRLGNPFDTSQQGWAADQFLRPLENSQ